jgi:hypothetical protein
MSVCQADASLPRSASARPCFAAILAQTGLASAGCGSSGVGRPGYGAASIPKSAASFGHSQRQRKMSPLTMLNA